MILDELKQTDGATWAAVENYISQKVSDAQATFDAKMKDAVAKAQATIDDIDAYKAQAETFVAQAENAAQSDLPDDKKLAALLDVLKAVQTPAVERKQAELRAAAAKLIAEADSLTA